jgi:hypothetical protein
MKNKLFLIVALNSLLVVGFLFQSAGCDDGWRPPEKCKGPDATIPDYSDNLVGNIHVGDSVRYTYRGDDVLGVEMGIRWDFENGTPSSASSSVVWVKYYTPGCWDVKITMKPSCKDKDQPFKRKSPGVCVVE